MDSALRADQEGVMKKCVSLLLLCFLVASAFAGDSVPLIHKRVSEVEFTVVAMDRDNRPLLNLNPADVTVLENGQPISHFDLRSAADLPLRLGIVLDLSDSTRKSWPVVRSALNHSVAEVFRPQDRLLLLTFNRRIELEQTVTEPSLIAPLLQAPTEGGLTALYDSVYNACKHGIFLRDGEPHRSALILLSDGEDDISMHGLNDAIDQAQLNGIAIYTISLHDSRSVGPGDGVLHNMAAATGGRDFVAKDAKQLQLALSMINQELRGSYLLYYQTADEGGPRNFRRVFILPTQHDGSRLRSRAGYYTKP
jgi:Ca-activated chloride channel family protein